MVKHYPPAYKRYREKNKTISIVLTKTTKDALDNARGDLSYNKFVQSLFVPDGAFSQFEKQRIQLASERVTLENEIKKQRTQLASEKVTLENKKKKLAKTERFYAPCLTCGKQMLFENTDSNWNSEIKPMLLDTFHEYTCQNCDK
jgi:hypothetical protein